MLEAIYRCSISLHFSPVYYLDTPLPTTEVIHSCRSTDHAPACSQLAHGLQYTRTNTLVKNQNGPNGDRFIHSQPPGLSSPISLDTPRPPSSSSSHAEPARPHKQRPVASSPDSPRGTTNRDPAPEREPKPKTRPERTFCNSPPPYRPDTRAVHRPCVASSVLRTCARIWASVWP
jgi:hypothetical protein